MVSSTVTDLLTTLATSSSPLSDQSSHSILIMAYAQVCQNVSQSH